MLLDSGLSYCQEPHRWMSVMEPGVGADEVVREPPGAIRNLHGLGAAVPDIIAEIEIRVLIILHAVGFDTGDRLDGGGDLEGEIDGSSRWVGHGLPVPDRQAIRAYRSPHGRVVETADGRLPAIEAAVLCELCPRRQPIVRRAVGRALLDEWVRRVEAIVPDLVSGPMVRLVGWVIERLAAVEQRGSPKTLRRARRKGL